MRDAKEILLERLDELWKAILEAEYTALSIEQELRRPELAGLSTEAEHYIRGVLDGCKKALSAARDLVLEAKFKLEEVL